KKIFLDEMEGKKVQDIWEYKDPAYPQYPTEKNIDLLKMIVSASSQPNSIVLDCFCGSGTTLAAAAELGRNWIGIDESEVAINTCTKRLLNFELLHDEQKPAPVFGENADDSSRYNLPLL
ncbi:MAG: site-specific DNA-methyltransferase, partial [Chloroflexi bacterium]|nr:site-specific DNA-methyltransferase [Chloroflexota bacterium]